MGGNAGASKLIRKSKARVTPLDSSWEDMIRAVKQSHVFVDMSVLIHAINSVCDIGYYAFKAKSQQEIEEVAAPYMEKLAFYLEEYSQCNVTYVLESKESTRQANRASAINTALRTIYHNKGREHLARKSISRNSGVPCLKILLEIADLLQLRFPQHRTVVVQAETADSAIIKLARSFSKPEYCSVVSCDADFLAFGGDAIRFLVNPIVTHRNIVDKRMFLQELRITSDIFGEAYCISGCDDVKGVARIGIVNALRLVSEHQRFNSLSKSQQSQVQRCK